MMPSPPVDPITVYSPSKKYKFWVNPSDPSGIGPSYCRLSRGGKTVWQKNLPYTFGQACVLDSGKVAGYAYLPDGQNGKIVVALFDSQGNLKLEHKTARSPNRMLDGDNSTVAEGFLSDPGKDWLVVRVKNVHAGDGVERWWTYDTATFKYLKSVQIGQSPRTDYEYVKDAKILPGTPFILLNWSNYRKTAGQSFNLVDKEGKKFWGQDFPGDLQSAVDQGWKGDFSRFLTIGTILRCDQPGRFEVLLVKEKKRVTFVVQKSTKGWDVKEISREPYTVLHRTKPEPLVVKRADIPILAKVNIPQSADFKSDVSDVGDFCFWGDDKVVYLRRSSNEVRVVGRDGRLIRNISLPPAAQGKDARVFIANTSGANFVVVATWAGPNRATLGWKLDVSSGKLVDLPKFKAGWVESIAASPNGRFAVVSMDMGDSSSASHVSFHDADGTPIWIKGNGWSSNDPAEISSPEDVAFDAKGNIVVLDNIAHTLQFFEQSGKFLRAYDLDRLWGKSLSYPTQITCLPGGGFWLIDSETCYLLDAKGAIVRSFKATLANGKAFESREDVRVDRNGQPWITNGRSIFRVDRSGKAIQTIGNAPRLRGLGKIESLKVNFDGRIYALDEVTNGVHVFDAHGKPLFVANPKPSEFDDTPNYARLAVAPSGDIYVSGNNGVGDIHFSPTGQRLKNTIERQRHRHEEEFGIPYRLKPTWHWWNCFLLDESGKTQATLRRWPDLTWMEEGPSAMAPDGQLMAYGGRFFPELDLKPEKLAFFSSRGAPISQTLLPLAMPDTYHSAYDGNLCYFLTDSGLLAMDRQAHPKWLYVPPSWNSKSSWDVFASRGKLALYDGERTVFWIDPRQAKIQNKSVTLPLGSRFKD
ncbi:MAG: hypothetical protein JST51_05530 [Armatimonadetes bacterium]|nr:hypothetical protein [Armatimonadota bacterium]